MGTGAQIAPYSIRTKTLTHQNVNMCAHNLSPWHIRLHSALGKHTLLSPIIPLLSSSVGLFPVVLSSQLGHVSIHCPLLTFTPPLSLSSTSKSWLKCLQHHPFSPFKSSSVTQWNTFCRSHWKGSQVRQFSAHTFRVKMGIDLIIYFTRGSPILLIVLLLVSIVLPFSTSVCVTIFSVDLVLCVGGGLTLWPCVAYIYTCFIL